MTVDSDKTGQYIINQRLKNVTLLCQFDDNIINFYLKNNNNNQGEMITNYNDFKQSLMEEQCFYTLILNYGPPYHTYDAGSYTFINNLNIIYQNQPFYPKFSVLCTLHTRRYIQNKHSFQFEILVPQNFERFLLFFC